MKRLVVELCYIDTTSTEQSLYLSDMGFVTGLTQAPVNTVIEGRLVGEVTSSWRLANVIWDGQGSSSGLGTIQINNADGALDYLLDYQVRDCPVYVHEIDPGDDIDTSSRQAAAIIDRIQVVNDRVLQVVTFERATLLEKLVQGDTYDGTQANKDLTGQVKPLALGLCRHVKPYLITPNDLQYQVNHVAVTDIQDVYDRGAVLTEGALPPANYSVNESAGTLELHANPDGQITVTVAGEEDTGAVETYGPNHLDAQQSAIDEWVSAAPVGWTVDTSGGGSVSDAGAGNGTRLDHFQIGGTPAGCHIDTDDAPLTPGVTYRWEVEAFVVNVSGSAAVDLKVGGVSAHQWSNTSTLDYETFAGQITATSRDCQVAGVTVFQSDNFDIRLRNLTVRPVIPPSIQLLPIWFEHILTTYADLMAADVNTTEAEAIQTVRAYKFNRYVQHGDVPTVRELLDATARSIAGWYYTDDAGVFHFGQLGPASNTPVMEIFDDEIEGDIVRELNRAPGLTGVLNVDRNWSPYGDGSIAGVVDAQLAQRLTQQYLGVVKASNLDVLDPAYSHAKDAPPRETLLIDSEDVPQVEIDRQIGLYAQPRYFWRVPGVLDDTSAVTPGSTVRLWSHRYRLQHGTDLVAVGATRRHGTRKADLVCWGTAGRYRVEPAHYSGQGNYLTRATPLVGLVDAPVGTICASLRLDVQASPTHRNVFKIGQQVDSKITLGFGPDLSIRLFGKNAANAPVFEMFSDALPTDQWISILASWDLSVGVCALYIDDVLERDETSPDTTTISDNIGYSASDESSISGRASDGLFPIDGALTHLGFAAVYVDLGEVANRRRFFDQLNRPVDGGQHGRDAFGVPAPLWMSRTANLGIGGPYVEHGTITTASDSPTDDRIYP